jgi:hypothetical protein
MFVTIFKTHKYSELKVVDIKVGTKKKLENENGNNVCECTKVSIC